MLVILPPKCWFSLQTQWKAIMYIKYYWYVCVSLQHYLIFIFSNWQQGYLLNLDFFKLWLLLSSSKYSFLCLNWVLDFRDFSFLTSLTLNDFIQRIPLENHDYQLGSEATICSKIYLYFFLYLLSSSPPFQVITLGLVDTKDRHHNSRQELRNRWFFPLHLLT